MSSIAASSGQQETPRTARRTALLASLVGSSLEWYDFALYAASSALIFSKLFFVSSDPAVATFASLGTFAIGFLIRPVGGMIFGSIGDRMGRKKVLVVTLLMMGVATFLIGVLPTYSQVGVLAPILLLVLRLVQGLGAGAEFGGATLVATEYAGDNGRRGLYATMPATGQWLGSILATGSIALVGLLPEDQFISWGWRLPFLASIVIVAFGLYTRARLAETPVFREAAREGQRSRQPLRDLLRHDRRSVVILFFAQLGVAAVAYFYQVGALSYAVTDLDLTSTQSALGLLIAAAVAFVTTPLFGALSDRIGRKPVLIGGIVFLAVFTVPFFTIAAIAVPWTFWLALTVAIGLGVSCIFGAQGAFYSELFSTRVRFSGFTTGREWGNALGGGFSPIIGVALLGAVGSPWLLIVFAIVMSVVSILAIAWAPETAHRDVTEAPDAADVEGAPPTEAVL